MQPISTTRTVAAPPQLVFDVVANHQALPEVLPHIVAVEFLSEQTRGVGAKFRETRMMGKKKASTELEVTEFDEPNLIRIVSDAGGTTWDTVFTCEETGEDLTQFQMVMTATPHNFAAKMLNKTIRGMILKAVEKDMDMIKAHCEAADRAVDNI